jgi:hypothetical protein
MQLLRSLFALILIYGSYPLVKAQESFEDLCPFREQCIVKDSTIKLIVFAGEYPEKYRVKYCEINNRENFETTALPDSIAKIFTSLVTLSMGENAVSRVSLRSLSRYNDPDTGISMSTSTIYFPCNKVRFKHDCILHFDDSLNFPFEILTDVNGKIINLPAIPQNLKEKKSFKLISPCEAFTNASADDFVKKDGLWNSGISLLYSKRLKIFYYEIQVHGESEPIETNDFSVSKINYIFVNAHTAKVIWKATADVYRGHQECPKEPTIDFPRNSLTDE